MIRTKMRTIVAATALAALVAVGTAAAGDLATGPLVQASGASPFTGCTADGAAAQSGTFYPDSEVEPWIDVNPLDPDNLIGIYQQDRWTNGGSRGLVASVSFDGGSSFDQVVIPHVTLCSGGTAANRGNYDRASDPWVSYGPSGIAYQLSLSFNDANPPFDARDFDHALLASRSTDGGLTWSDPVVVIRDLAPTVFNDKQSITADPLDARYVYSIWDRLAFPSSERASVVASFHTSAFRGPVWFARSTDSGQSWERARQIYDPGQNDQTIGNQIVVHPSGRLVDIFDEIRNDNRKGLRGGNVAVLLSDNRGVSWSSRIVVDRLGTIGVSDPDTGDPVRTGDIIPDIAVDPSSGALYAAWQDARFGGFQYDGIALSRSVDGGRTWSPAIKVNQTPGLLPPGNQQAFTPSVDVAANGTVAVTYYDFRNNTPSPGSLETDVFAAHCHPATPTTCTDPANWGDETQLTDTSFDMRDAPFAGGFFTGDYEGLASAGDDFTAFFSQSHDGDPASTFFRRAGS